MFKTKLNENSDFIKTCRLCLNQNNELISIFDISSAELQYLIIINECTEVMISENDQLPKKICLECIECLNKFYQFRKLVVNSERCLNELLNQFSANLNKYVKVENINNNKEIDSNESIYNTPVKSEKDPLCSEETSKVEIKMEVVEEKLEICKNEIFIQPTSVIYTSEEMDNSHNLVLAYNNSQSFTCKFCGKNLTGTNALKLHLKKCTKPKKSVSHITKDISTSSQLVKRKKFNNKSKKSFMCEICGKSFSLSTNLLRHKLTHTDKKPYGCDQCGKSFSDLYYLNVHKRIHTGDTPYKCKLCDKSFITSSNLKVHQIIHTDKKPYQCTQCGKCFTQLGHLKKHEIMHTGKKLYNCNECGKFFSDLWYLNKHKRFHTGNKPYRCKLCEKSFINSSNLRVHEIHHTGKKPYNCIQCGKSFTQLANLKTHKKIHTGEKSYKCTQCGKSFIQFCHLKKHEKLHTDKYNS